MLCMKTLEENGARRLTNQAQWAYLGEPGNKREPIISQNTIRSKIELKGQTRAINSFPSKMWAGELSGLWE